ncbi:MAG TPA: amidase family protein [Frankiaceae bacterium]|nr:amidase family protein [Frankiaceae bacterium]
MTVTATPDDLQWADAVGLAELVRTGAVAPGELVDAAIERLQALEPRLQLLVSESFERARKEAAGALPDGPFRGVPFLLKDAVQHSEGDPYGHGLASLKGISWRSPHDTELAHRYRRSGLVLLGRTKVPELTMSSTTEPLAYGPAHNPWSTAHSTGGSSGGSAAAVAAGIVPVAHGNDMGGSIRIPASCCGAVGLKPSRWRTSFAPDYGEYWGPLTHEHVITRTVRDSAAVLDATAGSVPGDLHMAPPPVRPWLQEVGADPGHLRIGMMLELPNGAPVDPECVRAATETAALLEGLGHHIEPFSGASLVNEAGSGAMSTLIAVGLASEVVKWEQRLAITMDDLEPMPTAMVAAGRAASALDVARAVDAFAVWSREIAAKTGVFDVLLSPTMAILPPLLGTLSGDQPLDQCFAGWGAMCGFAIPFDVSGQPAISLPLHWSETGLPIGVQLVAGYGREDVLFRLAGQLEQARPWSAKRPPLTS